MDPTEDLSARVLLRHILSTEPPQTPITRSASTRHSSIPPRRSSRLSDKGAGPRTPQDILRRSLRHKIHESITRKSLPATKRRTASVALRQTDTLAPTSMLLDVGDTPRPLLMKILQTEPVRSPVVHKQDKSEEPQPSSASSSTTRKRPSAELSGLDLPDLSIVNAASAAKGLSRKRPRRSLNVTAFEQRLKDGDDIEEENEGSIGDHPSLSLSNSSSLSLQTPFADVQTKERGLKIRASNRRRLTEEEFSTAVNKRQIGEVSTVERGASETAYSEGFTLGLSKLSEPDITTDVIHCNTALYAQPDATTSNLSILAAQDKSTVGATQLQRQMTAMGGEPLMEARHDKPMTERSMHRFPNEEGVVSEAQGEECFSASRSEDDVDAAETQKETGKSAADRPDDAAAMLKSEEEEGPVERQSDVEDDTAKSDEQENRVDVAADSQNAEEEDGAVDSPSEEEEGGEVESQPEDDAARSQSDEEEVAPDSQTEEDGEESDVDLQPEEDAAAKSQSDEEEVAPDSQTEEDKEGEVESQPEDDAARSQSDEEEVAPDSQTEEDGEESDVDLQPEEDAAAKSQSDEEEVAPDAQTEEEEEDGAVEDLAAVDSQSEEREDVAEHQIDHENSAEGGSADSEAEDEHDGEEDDGQASEQLERDLEHVGRWAHRSGGGVMPVMEAESGWSEGKSRAQSAIDARNSPEMGSHEYNRPYVGMSGSAESSAQRRTDASRKDSDADKGNTFDVSVGDGGPPCNDSPEEAAAQDPTVQEEEWEDAEDGEESEESEEVPSKTPAFVKQRIFLPDPPASPSVFKNVQASSSDRLPASKPKQRRKRTASATKDGGLPKSYLMKVFKHFAKTNVSADVYPVLKDTTDKFIERMAEDLETYALHAKRKTIEVEDVVLLLKRQGHVNDKVPVEVLIEKYLRMDQRKLLIPIATSGNVVAPMSRR